MNWKKVSSSAGATLPNPNFQSFCELGKSLKYSLRPTFKNPSLETKDGFKNAMYQIVFHC